MKTLANLCTLLTLLLLSSTMQASIAYDSISDAFHDRLARTTNVKDSILIMENLFDISLLTKPHQSDSIAEELYQIALRHGDTATALDMLRQRANLNYTKEEIKRDMLKRAMTFDESDDRSSTIAFIRMGLNSSIREMTEDQRKQHLHDLLHQYTINRPKDIYDQIVLLHAVCTNLGYNSQGEMLLKYMDRLKELVEKLPPEDYVLRNSFYVQGAINYAAAEQPEKANELDKKLLTVMDSLEAKYAREGRPYRNFDANRYLVYRRLLSNWDVLSPNEIEKYYRRAKRIINSDPRAKGTNKTTHRIDIYYAMAKKDYANALAYLKEQIDNPQNAIYKRQLLRYMITSAEAVGDKEALSHASKEYIRILEESLNKSLINRYKELQVLYDVYDIRSQNDQLMKDKLISQRNTSRTIAIICGIFLVIFAVCALLLVRLYRRTKSLGETLARSNKALQLESLNLRNSQAELNEARNMAEKANSFKTMFIKNMSREVMTPLETISEYSHLIVDCTEANTRPYLQRYAQIVERNCELLTSIVNDVLHLSEVENEDFRITSRQIDLKDFISICIDSLRDKSDGHIKPTLEDDLPDIKLYTDSRRLQQIMLNILSNAVKFTEKGSISIGYNLSTDGEQVIISVTDTGIGVKPEHAEKIFEGYYTVNESGKSDGLGLTISRMLARVLGGDLILDTSYRHGARFILTLPYRQKSSEE